MKKTFILLVLGFFFISGFAQTIEKTFYFKAPQVSQYGLSQTIEFSGTMLSGKPGEPILPFREVSLLLPPGHEAVGISVEGFDEVSLPGYFKLLPAQFSRPLSQPGFMPVAENEAVYHSADIYPSNPAGHLSTGFMNGYALAQTVFTPVQYKPASGEISYFQKVVVRIQTRVTEKASAALLNLQASLAKQASLQKFIENPEAIYQYPIQRSSSTDYQILIITPQQFATQMNELAQLYLPRGLKSNIATVESIQSGSTGLDLPEKIRNFIIQEYQQHNIEHVVLGGDVEHVPHRGFYCMVQSSSVYEDSNIPSDLYYSALDGNWNNNENTRWGEIGEDDLLPEISVGRMSFSNALELSSMLNKTTLYQNQPVTGELRNPLLAGENLYTGPDTWGSDYLELLIGTHTDNGYTTTGIPEDHNFERLYDEIANWSKNDLMNSINAGRNFVHHVGHANDSYVMKLNSYDITNSNFSGTNGITHNFPVVYTHGCICGAFDVNDCIAEKMVSINNFASAFVGNSRYGWFNEGQTEGPSQHLHREFVDALFTDSLSRIGAAHTESKIATAPWVNAPGQWEEGALRWCFYDCNVLGDPMMAIWTNDPIEISVDYPQSMPTGTMQFDITVTSGGAPAGGLTAALLMNGELFGTGLTGSNGQATVLIDPVIIIPGDAQLVISGYNCLPNYFPISFVSGNSAYVVYQSHLISDPDGNNNGEADFGEELSLSITLQNIGQQGAYGVSAMISSNDPYVNITDNSAVYGDIPAGSSLGVNNGFSVQVSENVPDNYPVEFTITAQGGDTWLSAFQMVVNAPVVDAGDAVANDNENGIPDPDEVFDMHVQLFNTGHANSLPVSANLSSSSPFVQIPQTAWGPQVINAQSQTEAIFEGIAIDAATPVGSAVSFHLTLTQGDPQQLILEKDYTFVIGQIIEDFESGGFTQHPWQHGGNMPWTITSGQVFERQYAARSGQIGDNQETDLLIEYHVLANDSIHFYVKTSSESGYDYLRFYINDVKKGEWSGELEWKRVSFAVSAGDQVFKWSYEKDNYMTGGSDAAWIDYVQFPPADVFVGINQPESSGSSMVLSPNPASDNVQVFTGNQFRGHAVLIITDLSGRILFTKDELQPNKHILIPLNHLNSGLYIVQLQNDSFSSSRKLIVR